MKRSMFIPSYALAGLSLASLFLFTGCSSQLSTSSSSAIPDISISGDELASSISSNTNEASNSDTAIDESSKISIHFEPSSKTLETEDGTPYYYIDYSMPVVSIPGNDSASQKINAHFQKECDQFTNLDQSDLDVAMEEYQYSLSSDYVFNGYSCSQSAETSRIDSSIISLKLTSYYFSGGAHGSSQETGVNFDTATGELLSLASITDQPAALNEAALSYIKESCKAMAAQNMLFEDYESSLPDIIADGNWYFTKGGITFVAQQYLIAPYAAGIQEFEVPYELLPDLKPEYAYTGNLQRTFQNGSTASYDLNGDGTEDSIYYSASNDDETYDVHVSLSVNGVSYEQFLQDNNIYFSDGYLTQYALVDLDTSDSYTELAIMDRGPSDDPVTYFFRYDGNQLIYLGLVPDLLANTTCYADGDGLIHADTRISMLETRTAPMVYSINDNQKITVQEEEWYYPEYSSYTEEYNSHAILQNVTVYQEKSKDSEPVVLTASDGPVSFPAIDNKNWVQVQTKNNQIYYMYMDDFSTIDSDGEKLNSSDVFDQMLLAD